MTRRISEDVAAEVAELFLETASGLHAYACTLPDVDTYKADDLVQEAFHQAALKWKQLVGRDLAGRRAWLFTVIRRKSIDHWRRDRKSVHSPEPPEMPSFEDLTADRVLSATALAKCWAVIQGMPPIRQTVAHLRWSEDWTAAEIAGCLKISQSTVRGHLKVARDELMVQAGADVPFISDPEIDEGG